MTTKSDTISPERCGDELVEVVIDHYARSLERSKRAMAYLEREHIGDAAVWRRLRLGFVDRTLGHRLPSAQLKAGKRVRSELVERGLLRSSGHEAFRGCLFVPAFDAHGRLAFAYGRRVGRAKGALAGQVFVTSGIPPLWRPWPRAQDSTEMVLAVEMLDALRLVAAGVEAVAGVLGSDGWSPTTLRELQDGGVTHVRLVAVDGTSLAARIADDLEGVGISVKAMTRAELRDLLPSLSASSEPHRKRRPAEAVPANEPPVVDEAPAAIADPDERTYTFGDRFWRVRNILANRARGTLKVGVLLRRGDQFHLDTLDLDSARQRTNFVRSAASELTLDPLVVKHDLGKVLLAVEAAQEEMLHRVERPEPAPVMSAAEREQAMAFLTAPDLLDRLLADCHALGIVGECDNLLLAYLATVSRLLDHPLSVIVQSSAAAGKSNLLQTVLSLLPPEAQHVYSAITGQSLYYMGTIDLGHGVLCIAEEAGLGRATHALKLLQSDGKLTLATTAKHPETGRLEAQEHIVQGPVAILMTTTSLDLDPELASRSITLTVDESPEQTRRIHESQRAKCTVEGLRRLADVEAVRRCHHAAHRLLESLPVVVDPSLWLDYEDQRVRSRRDHAKLLALVQAVTLLHQHQRVRQTIDVGGKTTTYLEAEPCDIELATRLLSAVTPGIDELPPQTRRLLGEIEDFVDARADDLAIDPAAVRFSRREITTTAQLGPSQLKLHLSRLVEAELLERSRLQGSHIVLYGLRPAAGRPRLGRTSAGVQERPETRVRPSLCVGRPDRPEVEHPSAAHDAERS